MAVKPLPPMTPLSNDLASQPGSQDGGQTLRCFDPARDLRPATSTGWQGGSGVSHTTMAQRAAAAPDFVVSPRERAPNERGHPTTSMITSGPIGENGGLVKQVAAFLRTFGK